MFLKLIKVSLVASLIMSGCSISELTTPKINSSPSQSGKHISTEVKGFVFVTGKGNEMHKNGLMKLNDPCCDETEKLENNDVIVNYYDSKKGLVGKSYQVGIIKIPTELKKTEYILFGHKLICNSSKWTGTFCLIFEPSKWVKPKNLKSVLTQIEIDLDNALPIAELNPKNNKSVDKTNKDISFKLYSSGIHLLHKNVTIRKFKKYHKTIMLNHYTIRSFDDRKYTNYYKIYKINNGKSDLQEAIKNPKKITRGETASNIAKINKKISVLKIHRVPLKTALKLAKNNKIITKIITLLYDRLTEEQILNKIHK